MKKIPIMLLIVALTIALMVSFSIRAMAAKLGTESCVDCHGAQVLEEKKQGLITECCVDCHVVHKWEDQAEREKAAARAKARLLGVYTSDMEEACEGCHAAANSHVFAKAGLSTVPIVKNAKEPENPLSGGNFYYKSGQSHFEKAGGSCSSCHRNVRHHAATKAGYRFLGKDIKGIGDPMYEHGYGHNIYQSGDQYCIACHANFCGSENQRSDAGWIRHPTNTPLPMTGEYADYVYRKAVPVSYPDTNKPERANARVMCMSCHRPHGTPYNFLLRWDYNIILAGGEDDNETGCFACHTTKDTGN